MDATTSTVSMKKHARGLLVMSGGLVAFTGLSDMVQSFAVPRANSGILDRALQSHASADLTQMEPQRQQSAASRSLPTVGYIGGAAGVLALSTLAASSTRRASAQRRAVAVQRSAAVGDKVTWSGKEGTVRYVGPTKFAGGEWVGIELDTAVGMHDGSVMGVSYFECPGKTGVFAQATQLSAAGGATPAQATAPQQQASSPASTSAGSGLCVGSRVRWNDQEGTVRFMGATKFAAGEWVGIQLDAAAGMHDGSVLGVSYFECAMKTGVFAQAAQLTAVGGAPVQQPSTPAAQTTETAASAPEVTIGSKVRWNDKDGTVRYLGGTKFAAGEWVGIELDTAAGMHDGSVMGVSYFSCPTKTGVFAQAAQLSVTASAPAGTAAPQTEGSSATNPEISLGSKVRFNDKEGTVRFIGSTQFAGGEWVGLELDAPTGKHDGTVMGVNYFTSAPGCGIFTQATELKVLELVTS